MSWDDGDLVQASFRGFAFAVERVSDSIDRRVIEHEFLYRDGANLDDTGRRARPFRFTAFFLGPGYLAELTAFMRICDEGKTGTLVHPLFGQFQAKCVKCDPSHSHERRNHASLELEFKEDGTNTRQAIIQTAKSAAQSLSTTQSQAQTDLDGLGLSADDTTATQAAIDNAGTFADDIEATPDDLSARYDELRKSVDEAVDELEAIDPTTTWQVAQGVRDMLTDAQTLKEAVETVSRQVLARPVPSALTLRLLALDLYDDPERDIDLLRLNKVRNPFMIPAGAELLVYSE
ncbi:MAG: DNA circularization N-terminal domain-containing protein [Myxococcales bacterium]|nr:DNA circularization N-terminal domain-containing protein [Myxococcales bacterium]